MQSLGFFVSSSARLHYLYLYFYFQDIITEEDNFMHKLKNMAKLFLWPKKVCNFSDESTEIFSVIEL